MGGVSLKLLMKGVEPREVPADVGAAEVSL